MTCSWCGKVYTENSIYHICDNGTTFDQRQNKGDDARRNDLTSSKDYNKIDWTPYDLNILAKAKIKP